MCTKQGSKNQNTKIDIDQCQFNVALSRRKPKYFEAKYRKLKYRKTEVSKLEISKTEVSEIEVSKIELSERERQNSKCERRKSKLFLFSAQVHVGLKDEVQVSKSRCPRTFYLIAQCMYLLKTKFENRNLGVRNAF